MNIRATLSSPLDRGAVINNNADPTMAAADTTRSTCPHCAAPIPRALLWKSLFAGQTAHSCPVCKKKFRLTYAAKAYIAYLNVALILGFIVAAAWLLWIPAQGLSFLFFYIPAAVLILLLMPLLRRYEKTSGPYR